MVGVPARVAARIGPVLARLVEEERRRGRRFDEAVVSVVRELDALGRAYRARQVDGASAPTAVCGSRGSAAEEGSVMVEPMTVAAVAELLATGQRNVRDLASRGRIPARRDGGQWIFDRADVLEYAADRAGA